MTRRIRYWVFLAALLAALAGVGGLPPFAQAKPSVLLVTLDTTRADRLGCYGKVQGLSPFLDRWASQSVLFKHCETAVPETVPSHVTILSGRYPNRHGVRKNMEVRVPAQVPLLAEGYEKAGYSTGAFISAFVLMPYYGLGRGFAKYDDSFYDPKRPMILERKAEETLSAARRWLSGRKEPWFCWVHLYDPHLPYAPPPPFDKRFAGAPYDGEIAYMDQALSAFFGELEKGGQLQNAVVVICGDHGESLGEHGEAAHGLFVYEATTWVPLIIRPPGLKAGRVVDTCVSLADVAPTLRQLCGLPAAEGDGVSLRPALEGGAFSRPPPYLEGMTSLLNCGWAPLYGLVDWPSKFILAPRSELYRVDQDPGERVNLYKGGDKTAIRLESALKERLARTRTAKTEALILSQEELRSLTSLGYIAGGVSSTQGNRTYRDPKDVIHLFPQVEKASLLMQSGKPSEAAAIFERILKEDPTNPTLHYLLGRCYDPKVPDRALAEYKEAVKYGPTFSEAYKGLVFLLQSQRRYKEAYDIAALALTHVEDVNGRIRAAQAWSALALGKPVPEVLGILDRAAKGAPETPQALWIRALIALKSGNRQASLGYLEGMAAASPPQEVALLESDDRFKELRSEDRFQALIAKAKRALPGTGQRP